MVWNNESKKGYMDHKIGKHGGGQPPKYANEFKKWLDAEPACDPAIPNDCITQDGRAGHFNANASCHVRGFGGNKTDGTCCNQHAADMMLKKLDEVDYILVGWEHANINYLAASLAKMEYDYFTKKVSKVHWHGSDYDRIYEMHFTPDGHGSYEYKPDGSNYDKRQDFDYPIKANYTTTPDGMKTHNAEKLHKAYLGPQSYCGAVAESSIPKNAYNGTLYDGENKISSLGDKDRVNGPKWIGPPLDRTQPRDDSACFGQVFDKDAVDTNKNSDSKCYEYPVP